MSVVTPTLSLTEFRARLAHTLDLVEQGQAIYILRHGKPVAQVAPLGDAAAVRVPSWKQAAFEPVHIVRADAKTGAQLIIEARQNT